MANTETVWYRHKTQNTLHEVVVGSTQHKTMAKALTEVDESSQEVPEPVYEKVSLAEVRKLDPSKVPGYTSKEIQDARRQKYREANGGVIIQQTAPGQSEDEIAARIDAAVKAAVDAAVAALTPAPAEPQNPADQKPAATTASKGK